MPPCHRAAPVAGGKPIVGDVLEAWRACYGIRQEYDLPQLSLEVAARSRVGVACALGRRDAHRALLEETLLCLRVQPWGSERDELSATIRLANRTSV